MIWRALYTVTTLITLYFVFILGAKLVTYTRVSTPTQAHSISWHIIESQSDAFFIGCKFAYDWDGETYFGEHIFETPTYQNKLVAQEQMEVFSKYSWQAYLSPSSPMKVSLQHNYPFKETVRVLLSLAIVVYFWGLRHFVSKRYLTQ